MKTEAEAKQLWCQMTGATGGSDKCIASGCMAWRWTTGGRSAFQHQDGSVWWLGEATEAEQLSEAPTVRRMGRCGMAGE